MASLYNHSATAFFFAPVKSRWIVSLRRERRDECTPGAVLEKEIPGEVDFASPAHWKSHFTKSHFTESRPDEMGVH
jgi:hypothetical protein